MLCKRLAAVCGVLLGSVLLESPAVAQQQADEPAAAGDDDSFRIGGSCAALAFLTAEQIKHHAGMAFSDELHAFCYPEEPFDCTDYTGFLKGLGSMSTGNDGYFCRLKLDE